MKLPILMRQLGALSSLMLLLFVALGCGGGGGGSSSSGSSGGFASNASPEASGYGRGETGAAYAAVANGTTWQAAPLGQGVSFSVDVSAYPGVKPGFVAGTRIYGQDGDGVIVADAAAATDAVKRLPALTLKGAWGLEVLLVSPNGSYSVHGPDGLKPLDKLPQGCEIWDFNSLQIGVVVHNRPPEPGAGGPNPAHPVDKLSTDLKETIQGWLSTVTWYRFDDPADSWYVIPRDTWVPRALLPRNPSQSFNILPLAVSLNGTATGLEFYINGNLELTTWLPNGTTLAPPTGPMSRDGSFCVPLSVTDDQTYTRVKFGSGTKSRSALIPQGDERALNIGGEDERVFLLDPTATSAFGVRPGLVDGVRAYAKN